MMEIDVRHMVPAFLLADKNGYAQAKMVEKALQIFGEIIQNGVDIILNVEKMPEWRLDEMAWEYCCLYDYNAPIESKRAWIRDSTKMFSSYGTIEALYKYLEGYFDGVEVEENWQYSADLYHFRITVDGSLDDQREKWTRMAVENVKNVRSVLDDIAIGSSATVEIQGEVNYFHFPYEMTGQKLCGADEI